MDNNNNDDEDRQGRRNETEYPNRRRKRSVGIAKTAPRLSEVRWVHPGAALRSLRHRRPGAGGNIPLIPGTLHTETQDFGTSSRCF
jgi:hypothetical protein